MNKNQNNRVKKALFTSMLIALMVPLFACPAFAIDMSGIDNVVTIFLDIFQVAATTIGAVIALWGIFQAILAFRREDSEGLSKQITTIVVGAALVGLGLSCQEIYNAIKG